MKKICMVVQDPFVKGGIAAVVNGYHGSRLEKDYKIIYVESYKDGGKITKLLKGISGYFHFVKVIIGDKPELVHIHSSFGPSFYRKIPFVIIASWARIPIVNHIHGADFNIFYLDASDKKKKLIKNIYSRCSKLVALSEEWKERLIKIVPENKISIIENYSVIHEEAYEAKLNRESNNEVLFLGELGQRKGCYDIPKVVKLVAKDVPNVKFILCGAGNVQDVEKIKEKVHELDIEKNVEFPGWVRDKKKDAVLCSADLFFLPSYNEGMPMSILDAMGYGLPIVSTNVGGIPKIVRNGENGICCAAGDVDSFAKGIIRILKDKSLRLQYAAKSMEIVKCRYSLDAHIDLLESLYEEVLK